MSQTSNTEHEGSVELIDLTASADPRPFRVKVNGEYLRNVEGGLRRFGSEATARKAAAEALRKAEGAA